MIIHKKIPLTDGIAEGKKTKGADDGKETDDEIVLWLLAFLFMVVSLASFALLQIDAVRWISYENLEIIFFASSGLTFIFGAFSIAIGNL